MKTPLSFAPIASATSAAEVEHLFNEKIHPSRVLRTRYIGPAGVEMNGVPIGGTSLLFLEHQAEYEVDSGEVDGQDSVIFGLGCGRASTSSFNGEPVAITDHAVIFSNATHVTHSRSPGAGEVLVRYPTASLVARIQSLLDRTIPGRIQFKRSAPLDRGVGAHARSAIFHILNSLDNDPVLLDNPLVSNGFEDLLLGLVLSMPNNFSDELMCTGGTTSAPTVVSRAEEYMEAFADSPITIADVLSHTGCSRKALFSNFRKSRGYTPHDFLVNARLKLAHQRLINAGPNDSVTSIAYDSGFSHMGRFSRTYRKRYGVAPSRTLNNRSEQ